MFITQLDQNKDDFSFIRKVELADGQVISAERRDPYGHVYISFKNGRVPNSLSGAFTSFPEAEKAISQYVAGKGKEKI